MDNSINTNQQNIIAAAEAIILKKGIKSTALADIAKEAGISKGTLYYYYSSKDDLIYEIAVKHLDQITKQLFEWIDEIKDKAVPEDIMAVAFKKLMNDETLSKLHLYLIQEAIIGNKDIRQKFIAKYREWKLMIENGLNKILGKAGNHSQTFNRMIMAIIDGFTIQILMGFSDFDFDEVAKLLIYGAANNK